MYIGLECVLVSGLSMLSLQSKSPVLLFLVLGFFCLPALVLVLLLLFAGWWLLSLVGCRARALVRSLSFFWITLRHHVGIQHPRWMER